MSRRDSCACTAKDRTIAVCSSTVLVPAFTACGATTHKPYKRSHDGSDISVSFFLSLSLSLSLFERRVRAALFPVFFLNKKYLLEKRISEKKILTGARSLFVFISLFFDAKTPKLVAASILDAQTATDHEATAGFLLAHIYKIMSEFRGDLFTEGGVQFAVVLERNFGGNPLCNAIVQAMINLANQSRNEYARHLQGNTGMRGASADILQHIRFWHDNRELETQMTVGVSPAAPFLTAQQAATYERTMLLPQQGVFDHYTCGLVTGPSNKNIGFEMLRLVLLNDKINVHPKFFTESPNFKKDTIAEKIIEQLRQCLRMPYKLKYDPKNPEKEVSLPDGGVGMAGYTYGKKIQPGTKDDLITSLAMLMFVTWRTALVRALQV